MSFLDAIKGLQNAVIDNFREEALVVLYPVDDPWTPVRVPGVFDDKATYLDVGDGSEYSSSYPLLGIRDSDHQAKRGDEVEVRGKRYRAADIRPDGQGFSVLVLEQVV